MLLVWGACYNDVISINLGVKTILVLCGGVGFLLPIKKRILPHEGMSVFMENLQQIRKLLEERNELRWGDNKK